MSGIQTFILLVVLVGPGSLSVPGYGSIAECEKAAELVRQQISGRVFCIPGPVEATQR